MWKFWIFCLAVPAIISYADINTYQQWDVIDLTFQSANVPKQPSSALFYANFQGPMEQEMRVNGFYNGGTEWIIRFAPPTPGDWSYVTRSTVEGLSEQTDTLHVGPNNNLDRHGPLMLYPDLPQHFSYADGTPSFLLSFECDWLFTLDLDNANDIPNTKKLVDTIAANGFNQVVMNVYAHDVSWAKDPNLKAEHDFSSPSMWPFGGTNDAPDFRIFNVEYFKRLDRVMYYLNEKNIIAHLMIYVWNKEVTWPAMYSRVDDYYFYYVAARYQAFPNLVWDISKEALTYGRCDDNYIHNRIKRLRKWDGHKRLITVHDYGYCSRFPKKVDFISIQTWQSDLYSGMRNVRERHVEQPILNIEHGGYESGPYEVFAGDYTDPVIGLERAYECVFASTYPTYYWQCTAWNVIIPDPMNLPQRDRPQFEYYKYLRILFQDIDFSSLTPTQDLASSGYGLTDEESICMFLLPKENDFIHVHIKDDSFRVVDATWFNPLTGKSDKRGRIELQDWHTFQPPWHNQMTVLILRKSIE